MSHVPDRSPPPLPADLAPCVLHRGLVCLDAHQPMWQVDKTLALLVTTLAAIREADLCRITPGWARWYTALGGSN